MNRELLRDLAPTHCDERIVLEEELRVQGHSPTRTPCADCCQRCGSGSLTEHREVAPDYLNGAPELPNQRVHRRERCGAVSASVVGEDNDPHHRLMSSKWRALFRVSKPVFCIFPSIGPLLPREAGHLFQSIGATHSDGSGPPILRDPGLHHPPARTHWSKGLGCPAERPSSGPNPAIGYPGSSGVPPRTPRPPERAPAPSETKGEVLRRNVSYETWLAPRPRFRDLPFHRPLIAFHQHASALSSSFSRAEVFPPR
jgi:hypothetical protein